MKLAIGTALLILLAGTNTYAQEQEKEKPAPQEQKKQEPAAKEHPQAQQQHEQHDKAQEQQKAQDQQKSQQHQAQEQQKNQSKQAEKERSDAARQQQESKQQAAKQQQVAKQQQQQQAARQDQHQQDHQAQRDGGNRNGRRISEQDFHRHFGREHSFRVTRSEDRRFNYGGYYWVYNDPWPSGWAYTDDVYVDEIDGEYYLVDPVHPGLRLLIVIAD